MKPGIELDKMILEKIMKMNPHGFAPPYSTCMNAAYSILTLLHQQGYGWCIERHNEANCPTVHIISMNGESKYDTFIHFVEDMDRISQSAESLPHAICLAALKALE